MCTHFLLILFVILILFVVLFVILILFLILILFVVLRAATDTSGMGTPLRESGVLSDPEWVPVRRANFLHPRSLAVYED